MKIEPSTWLPETTKIIISKYGDEDGKRGWVLSHSNWGVLSFSWCPDKNYSSSIIVSTSSYAVNTSTSEPIWVRVTVDVDNGNNGYTVKFYTSTTTDGSSWTEVASTTKEGTTTIPNPAVPLELGSRGNGTLNRYIGKIYEAQVYDGIGGKCVASPNFDLAFPAGKTTFNDLQGNEVTVYGSATVGHGSPSLWILNASHGGADISYATNETRFDLLTLIKPDLVFINYGHNGGNIIEYQVPYKELTDKLLTKYPDTGVVCIAQNPQASPRTQADINSHAQRILRISTLAAKERFGLVDVYRAILNTDNPDAYSLDGVHPNEAGSKLWANEVMRFLSGAL